MQGDPGGDESYGSMMENLQKELASEVQRAQQLQQQQEEKRGQEGAGPKPPLSSESTTENNVDRTISKLLNDMSTATPDLPPEEEEQQQRQHAMIEDLMKEFEKAGVDGNLNTDALIDGMMEQMLAKELMYEPMKQVAEQFPKWLESNKSSLSETEYQQRCKQYECFKRLLHVYDTEPSSVEKLMALMQEVQE
mmetsp:Transcript_15455/g.35491  ORF Transcript_15455/g.35491 Transcript_15455/m.35491 type:complete len:193 (+) Transcript_15455:3-581(+)